MRTSTDPLGSLLSHRLFFYHHNQHWKAVCLISISFSLITFKKFNINIQDLHQEDWTFFNIFAISVVWSLLRLFGILDNSVDDLDIFRENNAELGPGIATNYWFGFLKVLLQSSDDNDNHIKTKIENYCDEIAYTTHECYGKVILFLQNDCNFNYDSERMESEQIYKCLPESQSCFQGTCNHDIEFRLGAQRKTMTVYWIYRDRESQDSSSVRIFFLYDPVTNLRTAMSPEAGWAWSDQGRRRNIQSFKETLDSLSGNISRSFVYLEFDALTDTPKRHPLSELVRRKIQQNYLDVDSGMSSDEN